MSINVPSGGNGNGRGSGWFRLALFAVQVVLIGGLPVCAFLADVYTDWQLTPIWRDFYYYGIVLPTLLGLGLLRVPEIIQAYRTVRNGNGG